MRSVLADLRAQVWSGHPVNATYWLTIVGKLLVTPAMHVVLLYRLSALLYRRAWTRPLAFALRGMAVVWGGTEIHPSVRIGPGLALVHSQKVIIGGGVRIGSGVRIHQGVTIAGDRGQGSSDRVAGCPVIGDRVVIGADAIVLGAVTVGDGAVVGAQSLVLHDVPAGAVVGGSPARVIRGGRES